MICQEINNDVMYLLFVTSWIIARLLSPVILNGSGEFKIMVHDIKICDFFFLNLAYPL